MNNDEGMDSGEEIHKHLYSILERMFFYGEENMLVPLIRYVDHYSQRQVLLQDIVNDLL